MSQVAGPYGLRVLKKWGEQYMSGGFHAYPLTANNATGFFFGDVVGLQAGQPVVAAASPAAGVPGVIGVFQGASWMDPVRGFVNSQYLPASIITAGATNVTVKVVDSPFVEMRVQADGPIALGQIGMNAALGNFGNGSTVTGDSKVNLASASLAVTATLAVKIVDYVIDAAPSPGAGSQPGDAFTDVIVIWNFGIHRFLNATGG